MLTLPKENKDDSFVQKIISFFFRLNIARKMLLGYLTLTILIFIISAFGLSTLNRLNSYNQTIITTYQPLTETTDKMLDTLLSQELYGRRYAILKRPEILTLYWEKNNDFTKLVEKISMFPDMKDPDVEKLSALHAAYNNVFLDGMQYINNPRSPLSKQYDNDIRTKQEEVIETIKSISLKAQRARNETTLQTSSIGNAAFRITAILCITGVVLSILSTILITRSIAGPIHKLKLATKVISEGKFDVIPDVKNRDELGDLSISFREMAKRLKRLEEMYLDASPLTRLPGNIAIENVLKKRLDSGTPLAFCHIDLDNFKAYNDRYGYAKGSELIKATAGFVETVVAQHGSPDDFVGHIGGDDFVVITTPDRYVALCQEVIRTFDENVSAYYDPEDVRNGYIIGKTRQGQEMRFPIMTISISVVTNTHRKLSSTIEIGEIAAELKHYAKSIPGSIYVVDKRRKDLRESSEESLAKFCRRYSDQDAP